MLPPGMPFEYQPSSMHAANRTLVRIVGQTKLNFRFEPNGKQVSFPVAVSPDIDGIIFGLNLLKNFECRWDMKTDSAEIASSRVQLHPHQQGPAVRNVYVASKTVLQPRHEHDVIVNMPRIERRRWS
jgi:hypothetical protein